MSISILADAPELLTRTEAADYLGVKTQTLSAWQTTGRYNLRVHKIGRLCKYLKSDLDAWLASRAVGGDSAE